MNPSPTARIQGKGQGRLRHDVEVAIIGAGGAGYPAAFLLAAAGRSVLLVDPIGILGGDCLAEGCVPSKAVRERALALATARSLADPSLPADDQKRNWSAVLQHKDQVQRLRYNQHREELSHARIELVKGVASIVGERTLEVESAAELAEVRFAELVIATGSAPSRLEIKGRELAITSHELFRLGTDLEFPSEPVIIGGGYIGVECASMLEHLGARPVVLELAPQLLAGFNPALAEFLHRSLSERVSIVLGAEVLSIEAEHGRRRVRYRRGGATHDVVGDAVVMATGRVEVLPEGMDHLGLNATGPIPVDATLRTSNPSVWAPGDVNGKAMLFHAAVRESIVVAHNILAGAKSADRMNFASVPFTVFTDPELASVGLGAKAAREAGYEIEVARYDYERDARAQILGATNGYLELVFDAHSAQLLGAHIAGVDAAQLIAPLALALDQRLGARALAQVAFPHPMLSEGINAAARQVLV
jgi:dihydrolipoamide dehydrogenase